MTTSSRERWSMLPPEAVLPLYLFAEIPADWDKAAYDVVIDLPQASTKEVQEMLAQHGRKDIVVVSDWDPVNAGTTVPYLIMPAKTRSL